MPIIHFSKPFAHSTVIIIRANEKLKTIRHSCLVSFFSHSFMQCLSCDMWMRIFIHIHGDTISLLSHSIEYRYIPKVRCCCCCRWLIENKSKKRLPHKMGTRRRGKKRELKPLELILNELSQLWLAKHTHYIGCMNKTCPFNEYCEMTKVSNA